jgi:ATP-dependent DNA ligase
MPLLRGFVPPCLPTKAPHPPSGDVWLHEIKHDGFRVIARKDGDRVRLYSRPGNDLTYRFPLIVESLARLRSRSCIIDGEAVCCGDDGVPSFDRIRYRRHDASVFLYAVDLIEWNGDDLRREPLAVRKATLELDLKTNKDWGPGRVAVNTRTHFTFRIDTSPASRTTRLHSQPTARPANAGPALLLPCARALA